MWTAGTSTRNDLPSYIPLWLRLDPAFALEDFFGSVQPVRQRTNLERITAIGRPQILKEKVPRSNDIFELFDRTFNRDITKGVRYIDERCVRLFDFGLHDTLLSCF